MKTLSTTFKRAFTGSFAAMVERLYNEEASLQGNGSLEGSIQMYFAQMSIHNRLWKRDTFRRLLLHMHAKKCYGVIRNPEHIKVLANISAFGNKLVREPESWKKDSLTAEGQLASLIRHCFAQYDVPEFMEYVFAADNKIHMLWYVQLGRGDSVQQLSAFPVELTKRMAHEFRETPNEFTVAQAIRRAQALGFGATAVRAEIIAWSSLHRSFEDEAFRAEVIQFIAHVPEELTIDVVEPVLEYVLEMHRHNPGFRIWGRTWAALARVSAEWHREMARKREAEDYREWSKLLTDFTFEEGLATFKIIELTNSVALYDEGNEMAHCVAEYVYDCMEGSAAIFSLRKFTRGLEGFETLVTIEVSPACLSIVQVAARYNEDISEEAEHVVKLWAKQENLVLDYGEHYAPPQGEAVFEQQAPRTKVSVLWFCLAQILVQILVRACD